MIEISLKIPPDLARQLRQIAVQRRAAVGDVILDFSANGVETWKRMRRMRHEAKSADVADAIAFLDELDARFKRKRDAGRRRKAV